MRRTVDADDFDRILDERHVTSVFQPIVDFGRHEVVGFEALARGPAGSPWASPAQLFAEAYRRGRVAELDWACRAAAFRAALGKQIPPEVPLLINVEPAALNAPPPDDVADLVARATDRNRFIIEITERSLAQDPAALVAAITRLRDASIGVAIDDVGAEPASLALMPILTPDVVKLDLSLIQQRPSPEIARIVNAVLAETERTGATIVAEGVESARHLRVARSMGATLAQGLLFGAPGGLPDHVPVPAQPLRLLRAANGGADSPFEVAAKQRRSYAATRGLLAATSEHLENEVLHETSKAVLVSNFQVAANFTPAIRRRYERLAESTVLTAVLGQHMPTRPATGVRGGHLDADDPLRNEWTVAALGPHFAAALIAHRIDDSPPTGQGQFEAVVTHDRDLVIATAKTMLARVPPLP
jgi:EAL domain-containing protein (putative c-di-GMP-specific phosphodiesterase class I)